MKIVPTKIIDSIVVTEKSTHVNEEHNVLTIFTSSCNVTKYQVKNVMRFMFPELKIRKIRSMLLHAKVKFFKGKRGVRVKRKKMMLFLEKGQVADLKVGV